MTRLEKKLAALKSEGRKGLFIYITAGAPDVETSVRAMREAEKVGDIGVSLTTVGDVETLLKDLKLDKFPLYVYAGQSAVPMLALYELSILVSRAAAKKRTESGDDEEDEDEEEEEEDDE